MTTTLLVLPLKTTLVHQAQLPRRDNSPLAARLTTDKVGPHNPWAVGRTLNALQKWVLAWLFGEAGRQEPVDLGSALSPLASNFLPVALAGEDGPARQLLVTQHWMTLRL